MSDSIILNAQSHRQRSLGMSITSPIYTPPVYLTRQLYNQSCSHNFHLRCTYVMLEVREQVHPLLLPCGLQKSKSGHSPGQRHPYPMTNLTSPGLVFCKNIFILFIHLEKILHSHLPICGSRCHKLTAKWSPYKVEKGRPQVQRPLPYAQLP